MIFLYVITLIYALLVGALGLLVLLRPAIPLGWQRSLEARLHLHLAPSEWSPYAYRTAGIIFLFLAVRLCFKLISILLHS